MTLHTENDLLSSCRVRGGRNGLRPILTYYGLFMGTLMLTFWVFRNTGFVSSMASVWPLVMVMLIPGRIAKNRFIDFVVGLLISIPLILGLFWFVHLFLGVSASENFPEWFSLFAAGFVALIGLSANSLVKLMFGKSISVSYIFSNRR
ncbi:hypothetical protein DET61_11676 [Marinobacter nauticus]|uniref:Uncharacterized protein n=2 Tax=Marinobacter nauticus TaxID=2743 RepID=A0A368X876_MARNT|nr:hypothetical protein DET61_11676 [Marinobacter nauticus]